jgi:repressor LexA
MLNLSERRKEIFRFIRDFIARNGYPPTYEEIRHGLELSSKSQVNYHLEILEEKGYLERVPNTPRGLRVLKGMTSTFEVPLLGQIAAGEPISFEQNDGDDSIRVTRDLVEEQDKLYALRVKGNSMIDALVEDGDIVIVKHQPEAHDGDMVAVRLKSEEETTLKRFYLEEGRVRLQPANPTMKPIYHHPANVEIQGKVVAVFRQP